MGTIEVKPYLADVMPLPLHPLGLRHPVTNEPIRAIGFRRNGEPVFPVIGGSQPFGDPAAGAAQQQQGQGQPQGLPVLGGQVPFGQPQLQPQMGQQFLSAPQQFGGQQQQFQPQQQPGQQFPFASFGQPQGGVTPPAPTPLMFASPQQQGQQQNGQQQGQQAQGQPAPQQGQQGQQQAGQSDQGGPGGTWDRPYPQGVPVDQMTVEQQRDYWKYHSRKNEAEKNRFSDYDQIKQQYEQLRAATATEWQRAQMDAEQRGRQAAMQQAGGQLVAFAFQAAAKDRMTPDQIAAQLHGIDPNRFLSNGSVDVEGIGRFVDTIAPPRPAGQQPGQQQLLPFMQQAGQTFGQQPYVSPQGQQAPFGAGQPQPYGQQQQPYGQPAYGLQAQQLNGVYAQPGYGQVPVPGVPMQYPPQQQVQQFPQPVVQPAGLTGLPGLPGQAPMASDYGQGPGAQNPVNGLQAGAAVAAARHGRTRSQQLDSTRGPQ